MLLISRRGCKIILELERVAIALFGGLPDLTAATIRASSGQRMVRSTFI